MATTFEFDITEKLPTDSFDTLWEVYEDFKVIQTIRGELEIPIGVVAHKDILFVWLLTRLGEFVSYEHRDKNVTVIVSKNGFEAARIYYRR